jgi:hypothetical protein
VRDVIDRKPLVDCYEAHRFSVKQHNIRTRRYSRLIADIIRAKGCYIATSATVPFEIKARANKVRGGVRARIDKTLFGLFRGVAVLWRESGWGARFVRDILCDDTARNEEQVSDEEDGGAHGRL